MSRTDPRRNGTEILTRIRYHLSREKLRVAAHTSRTRLLQRLARLGATVLAVNPSGRATEFARSLLALDTLLTLLATPADQLFFRSTSSFNSTPPNKHAALTWLLVIVWSLFGWAGGQRAHCFH